LVEWNQSWPAGSALLLLSSKQETADAEYTFSPALNVDLGVGAGVGVAVAAGIGALVGDAVGAVVLGKYGFALSQHLKKEESGSARQHRGLPVPLQHDSHLLFPPYAGTHLSAFPFR
jgi:hypothetical protein